LEGIGAAKGGTGRPVGRGPSRRVTVTRSARSGGGRASEERQVVLTSHLCPAWESGVIAASGIRAKPPAPVEAVNHVPNVTNETTGSAVAQLTAFPVHRPRKPKVQEQLHGGPEGPSVTVLDPPNSSTSAGQPRSRSAGVVRRRTGFSTDIGRQYLESLDIGQSSLIGFASTLGNKKRIILINTNPDASSSLNVNWFGGGSTVQVETYSASTATTSDPITHSTQTSAHPVSPPPFPLSSSPVRPADGTHVLQRVLRDSRRALAWTA
jgi:hypothetical protein